MRRISLIGQVHPHKTLPLNRKTREHVSDWYRHKDRRIDNCPDHKIESWTSVPFYIDHINSIGDVIHFMSDFITCVCQNEWSLMSNLNDL